ncbi:hypothetical protein ACJIZ3_015393 [Penstemon smallii]|uniref:BHLH domain-containing protein n=1 Tax=Penstemon smallii TaxID=265156 RepID=A0ABD3RUN6_9LAMI
MNNHSAFPEILHFLNTSENIEMSLLERQRVIQQQLGCDFLFGNNDQSLGDLLMKPDPGMENGSGFEMSYSVPRTEKDAALTLSSDNGRESFRKRKADYINQNLIKEKKMKGCAEEDESKSTTTTSTTAAAANNNNKKKGHIVTEDNSKVVPKQDYIHVRARRGQATDSHSLAERVRREKISERMNYLQDLVPGCNKITGKAGMLDEIINYVQSLQRQVEFLSMKLAAMNQRPDFDINNYLPKEMFQTIGGVSSDMVNNHGQDQFNALGQGVSCSGLSPSDVALRRTISAPIPIPDAILDSSCMNQIQQLTWDAELQNLYNMEYQQGRSASFISQPFTDYIEAGHVKMEM